MGIDERIDNLRARLEEKEVDAILVSQAENRRYLSGFDGSAGFLMVTGRHRLLATDARYTLQAREQSPGCEILTISGDTGAWLPALLSQVDIRTLGFEAGHTSYALYRQLCDILKAGDHRLTLVPLEGVVEVLRAVKEPAEIELMTRAAAIADSAVAYIQEMDIAGMTELEIAWKLEGFMREGGSQPPPFEVIVAAGPNAALPHAQPTERRVVRGEPVVIDIGARVDGYTSDLSRTLCPGGDTVFSKVYDTVLGAQLAAVNLIAEGMTGAEADSLARAVIEAADYGSAFAHGLGHGVGLATHELPRLGPRSTDILSEGMVFTIEPGVYLEGWGGVRIEDMVVMEKGGVREISRAGK